MSEGKSEKPADSNRDEQRDQEERDQSRRTEGSTRDALRSKKPEQGASLPNNVRHPDEELHR